MVRSIPHTPLLQDPFDDHGPDDVQGPLQTTCLPPRDVQPDLIPPLVLRCLKGSTHEFGQLERSDPVRAGSGEHSIQLRDDLAGGRGDVLCDDILLAEAIIAGATVRATCRRGVAVDEATSTLVALSAHPDYLEDLRLCVAGDPLAVVRRQWD